MNDLALRKVDLPSLPMEDVKQYVDVIGDAIDALKAKRNAAGHLNADKSVIDEMDAQIREYSAMKIKAEMELGKKTAAIETNAGARTDLRRDMPEVEPAKTKTETLKQMNIPPRRASEYETLAKNEKIVNEYIDRQIDRGETPTKSGAIKAIADTVPKPKTPAQMAQENIDRIKSSPVVPIGAADVLRREQLTVDTDTANTVGNEIHKICVRISHYAHEELGGEEFKTFCNIATDEQKKQTVIFLNQICGYATKLRNRLERI